MTREQIGRAVRAEREARGMTQGQVAVMGLTTQAAVSHVEQGGGYNMDTLVKILTVLDMSIDINAVSRIDRGGVVADRRGS